MNLINLDPTTPITLRRGDQIAQLVVQPVVRARFYRSRSSPAASGARVGTARPAGTAPDETVLEGRV